MEHAPAPGPPTGMMRGVRDRAKKRHAPTPTYQPSAWHKTDFPETRSLAAASGPGHAGAGGDRHRLAVAVGTGHHPLGRQGALPAADPVPGAQLGARRVAVLGALRVLRPAADRRPPVDDLLAALPAAGVAEPRTQPVGRRCDAAGHGVPGRRRADAVVPRPGLALGRRADRGARLRLRRRHGLAHPARRPGAEPRPICRSPCSAWIGRCSANRSSTAPPPASPPRSSCSAATRWRCSAFTFSPAFAAWRILATDRPVETARANLLPLAAGAASAAARVRRTRPADRPVRRRVEPAGDRLHRRRPRLAASGPAAHPGSARRIRRGRAAWRTTGARPASPGPTRACSSPRTWASSTSARSRCC